MQFFYWVSLLIVNGLRLLTNFLFWVFAFMFIKTLPTWTGLLPLIGGLWRLRLFWLGGVGFDTLVAIWQDIFTEAEIMNAHSLQIILHETGQAGALILNMVTLPLLVGNPIFWACAMSITFVCHNIISFICRCLRLAERGRVHTGDIN
jgi:hypothetical protein